MKTETRITQNWDEDLATLTTLEDAGLSTGMTLPMAIPEEDAWWAPESEGYAKIPNLFSRNWHRLIPKIQIRLRRAT